MTRPLQLMLKKDADPWTEKKTQVVKQLKTTTQNLPALVIPSTGHRILQTDASDQYWSVVLLKDKNGHRHICGYKSGVFKESETHYHSTFKQLKTTTQNLPALVIPSTGHRILQIDASDQY